MSTSDKINIRRWLAIGGISAVPLAVVAWAYNEQVTFAAASFLVLYVSGRRRLACCLLPATILCARVVDQTARLLPHTYDAVLWRWDTALGFNPLIAMRTFLAMPWLTVIAMAVYLGFMFGMALAFVASHDANRFARKLVIATGCAFLLYFIFPACGPIYFITSTVGASRNAMPSMHTTWALMIWYEMRRQNLPIRLAADLFLLFTVIATLGSGEHYVVDLLAAVPFWMLLEWLFTPKRASYQTCLTTRPVIQPESNSARSPNGQLLERSQVPQVRAPFFGER